MLLVVELVGNWSNANKFLDDMASQTFTDLDLHKAGRSGPKYEVFKSYLIKQLTTGRLKSGDPLPSERSLATTLRISRDTLRQAFADLENEGLIRRKRGAGTYVEEGAVQRLRKEGNTLALVVPDMQAPYCQELLRGFESQAVTKRQQVIVCCVDEDVNRQADVIIQLLDRGIGGIALWPTFQEDTPPYQVRHVQDQGVPVVLCHRPVAGIKAPFVSVSYSEIARMAGEAFLSHGHRQVAMVAAHASLATRIYEESLRSTMEAGGGALPESFVYYGQHEHIQDDLGEELIANSLRRMLGSPEPPTAILASFRRIDEVVYLQLQNMGLRIPQDISLVSIGDMRREGPIARRISTVVIDAIALGRRTAEVLQEMLCGQRTMEDTQEILIPLQLFKSESLGPAPSN